MKNAYSLFVLSLVFCCVTLSCTTTLYFRVPRPAQVDLNGAASISVLPFRVNSYRDSLSTERYRLYASIYSGRSNPQRIIADYITTSLINEIVDGKYFDLIDSYMVGNYVSAGKNMPCDVYITGYVTDWDEKIEKEDRKVDDKEVRYYRKNLKASVVYEIVDGSTKKVLKYSKKTFSPSSSWQTTVEKLPDSDKMLYSYINPMIRQIMKEIQPYTVTNKIHLARNDKAHGADDEYFEQALSYAKSQSYQAAEEMFLSMYYGIERESEDYNEFRDGIVEEKLPAGPNFPAGYNAAAIMIVQSRYDDAVALLEDLYEKAYQVRAIDRDVLNKIQKAYEQCRIEIGYQEKLREQKKRR